MNFPPFWAKGSDGNFICWRWSTQSLADAQALANQAAQQIAERFGRGELLAKHGAYYPNRPFREQVLHEIKNDAGELVAVVTRNSYGCEVLNTARVMFVDIDLPEKKSRGLLSRLFGKAEPVPRYDSPEAAVAAVENWTRNRPEWSWRIYRTRAGLRLMATHTVIDADSAMAGEVFEALGADPLYRTLCKTQKCFRARLTPKPWRCGIHSKPDRWPWLDANQEKHFKKWLAQYESFAFNWATCALIKEIGNPAVQPEIQTIIKLHDGATRVEADLKLA